MKALFRLLLVLAGAYCVVAGAGEKSEQRRDFLDTKTPVTWLEDHFFDKLEQYLDALYKQVQKKPADEYRLHYTYLALAESGKKTAVDVEAWLGRRPRSYQALLVQAGQYEVKARQATNGGKTYNREMAKSGAAAAAVLEMEPAHPVAHYFYTKALCDASGASCAFDLVPLQSKEAPNAFFARRALLLYMMPKWGGNSGMLEGYLDALKPALAQHPYWRPLWGYHAFYDCRDKMNAQKYEEALVDCEKAISFGVEENYLKQTVYVLAKLDRFSEAAKMIDRLTDYYPSDYWVGTRKEYANIFKKGGIDLARRGRNSLGIEALDEALRFAPDSVEILLGRARAHQDINHWQEAEKDYRRALAINPDSYWACEGLDSTLSYQKRFADIVLVWKTYVVKNPDSAAAHFALSRVYAKINDKGNASNSAQTACKLGLKTACDQAEGLEPNK